jgi:integrase
MKPVGSIHDLRHGFGTRAAGLGVNALVLRDALGHKTLAMTNRYVSKQTDPVRELANRVGAEVDLLLATRERVSQSLPTSFPR